jgi:secreted PhoX family phosphatase
MVALWGREQPTSNIVSGTRREREDGSMDRRTFLRTSGLTVAGVAFAGPLQALSARAAQGRDLTATGYGPLVDMGDLWLPEGFTYSIISREGEAMTDGKPTPSRFDGMAVFEGPRKNTVTLMRNHENRNRPNFLNPAEIAVDAGEARYDPDPRMKGGVTKLVVGPEGVRESSGWAGGLLFTCAGGPMPWGSWVTCEELFFPPQAGSPLMRHGYIYELDARAEEPGAVVPIKSAGRFEHEAVTWLGSHLYLTEDQTPGFSCLYRYTPPVDPWEGGGLHDGGTLEALQVLDGPSSSAEDGTGAGWEVGRPYNVGWVTVPNPDVARTGEPVGVRWQAAAAGATMFRRQEGCWNDEEHVYFDCTTGGVDRLGQIWEYSPQTQQLVLLFESELDSDTGLALLDNPDNLTVAPGGTVFLCEDRGYSPGDPNNETPSIRGLTPNGRIFEFARAGSNLTEFCGACFGPGGFRATFYVNQMGEPTDGTLGVTYAIKGPWTNNADLR